MKLASQEGQMYLPAFFRLLSAALRIPAVGEIRLCETEGSEDKNFFSYDNSACHHPVPEVSQRSLTWRGAGFDRYGSTIELSLSLVSSHSLGTSC